MLALIATELPVTLVMPVEQSIWCMSAHSEFLEQTNFDVYYYVM